MSVNVASSWNSRLQHSGVSASLLYSLVYCRFASVEQFWRIYGHLVRPGELSSHSDFHLFKSGIKPMWEDDANKCGGKWIVRLRNGYIEIALVVCSNLE